MGSERYVTCVGAIFNDAAGDGAELEDFAGLDGHEFDVDGRYG
jgi:hypothetical protein